MKENKNKADDKKKCFIIMPITTPTSMIEEYAGGKEHFIYVLNQIFIPAIEKSGLEPIPPITKGSDLIHGEIIKNIETSDLVLGDMSSLNPNVFFELGIRTSQNKPVALVVDDKTSDKIPFDTSIIQFHEYRSALQNWTHKEDINLLSNHINENIKRSGGENALWKYFSLSSVARLDEEKVGVEGQLNYLTMIVESLKEKFERKQHLKESEVAILERANLLEETVRRSERIARNRLYKRLDEIVKSQRLDVIIHTDRATKVIAMEIKGKLSKDIEESLKTTASAYGHQLKLMKR